MANLDSSWQASVIKLAQAGNSRAIAFWINRYLVPQGVCAQVVNEAGCLLIRVVCRQVPDSDRLVRFICHRLCKLDSEAIQQVRIVAQMVGSNAVLWEKSARIIPPTERLQKVRASEVQLLAPPATASPAAPPANVYPFPAVGQGIPEEVIDIAELEATSSEAHLPLQNRSAASPAKPAQSTRHKGKPLAKGRGKGKGKGKKQSDRNGQPMHQPVHQIINQRLTPLPKNWTELSAAWQHNWQPAMQTQLQTWQAQTLDFSDRTLHWLTHQKPATRAALLGGSALTAFLIGCSFELVGYYNDPSAFQRSKVALMKIWRSASAHSGSVNTAVERVAVIRQPVLNPDDPTVSLIFANSNTMTRLPASQIATTAPDGSIPPVGDVEAYRLADMLITNLNSPLNLTLLDEQPSESPKGSPSPSPTGELESPEPKLTETGRGESSEQDLGEEGEEGEAGEELLLSDEVEDEPLGTSDAPEEERLSLGIVEEMEEDGAEAKAEDNRFQPAKQVIPLISQELMANGVDVVNAASDLITPESTVQLTHTLGQLKQSGIAAIGAGQNSTEARRPQIFDVKGQRIAYLGYSDSSTHPARAVATGMNVSINQQMEADIKAIRDQVDWVIVNFSWNREVRAYPEAWQTSLTHAAIDHGADLVVGYHPTVTQGAEIYNGRAIVYSLGDAIDEYSDKPVGNYDAAALKVTLKEKVMELEFLPVRVRKGRTTLAKSKLKASILDYLSQASSLFDQPLKSPTSLNSEVRLTLPAAPDATMPTEPFINYPESPAADPAKPAP